MALSSQFCESVSWAVGRGLSLEDRLWEGEACHNPCHTPVPAFWEGAGSAEARGGGPTPGWGAGSGGLIRRKAAAPRPNPFLLHRHQPRRRSVCQTCPR